MLVGPDVDVVFIDLETTGGSIPPDPVQLSGVTSDGCASFDEYVLPGKAMEWKAAEVTGLYFDAPSRVLYKVHPGDNLQRIHCMSAEMALARFLSWLREVGRGKKVALVAYNGLTGDARVLVHHFERLCLPYEDVVAGFADPYVLARERRQQLGLTGGGLRLGDLVDRLGVMPSGGEDGSHNALFDADNLRKVTVKMANRDGGSRGDARRFLLASGGTRSHFKTPSQIRADMARAGTWGTAATGAAAVAAGTCNGSGP